MINAHLLIFITVYYYTIFPLDCVFGVTWGFWCTVWRRPWCPTHWCRTETPWTGGGTGGSTSHTRHCWGGCWMRLSPCPCASPRFWLFGLKKQNDIKNMSATFRISIFVSFVSLGFITIELRHTWLYWKQVILVIKERCMFTLYCWWCRWRGIK